MRLGTDMGTGIEWYGYKHISGTYQAKRYFSFNDILEARSSPFVKAVTGVFEAKDREHALQIIEETLR